MGVFIVEGCCGEYDDHYAWAVAAYLDNEELAKEHAKRAREFYLELRKRYSDREISQHCRTNPDFCNPFDPNMNISYTGPDYSYYALEVSEKLPNGTQSV